MSAALLRCVSAAPQLRTAALCVVAPRTEPDGSTFGSPPQEGVCVRTWVFSPRLSRIYSLAESVRSAPFGTCRHPTGLWEAATGCAAGRRAVPSSGQASTVRPQPVPPPNALYAWQPSRVNNPRDLGEPNSNAQWCLVSEEG